LNAIFGIFVKLPKANMLRNWFYDNFCLIIIM
jgi:hypothetical protein